MIILLTGGVGIGLYMGRNQLRRMQNRPGLIATHVLMGAGALEQLLVNVAGDRGNAYGLKAVYVLAITLALGFGAALVARESPQRARNILAIHAAAGSAGFLLFLAWLSSV
jgi:hypothetical protein